MIIAALPSTLLAPISVNYCPKVHVTQHNSIAQLIRSEATRAHLQPLLVEPRELLEVLDRGNDRPADVFIPHLIDGRHLCIDVSIVNTYSNMQGAAHKAGYNIERMEGSKRQKYEADLDRLGYAFTPFVMESFGGMGRGCDIVLEKIGSALADIDHLPRSHSISKLKSRITFKWMSSLGYSLASHVRLPRPV